MAQDPYDRPLVRGATHLVMAAFLIACPLVSVQFVRSALRARSAALWPRTPAVIRRSELVQNGVGPHQSVEAAIEYEYNALGQTYRGKKLHPSHGASSEMWMGHHQAIVDQFPVNTRTEAFYNPQDAAEAYLLTDLRLIDFIPILAPWMFFTLAVWWFVNAARRRSNSSLPTQ